MLSRLAPPRFDVRHPRVRVAKRITDLCGAAILLLLTVPVQLLVAWLVRWRLGAPVFFVQERAGQHGHPFRLYKFRTMSADRDAFGALLPDAERLGKLGTWLRNWSLDELPQLWNVFCGDLSLVGPRPLPLSYISRYTASQAVRLRARPGITGWAQVHGRNRLDWNERFRLDVWYVENESWWLDMRILALTLSCVLRRDGITAGGEATMYEFLGPAAVQPGNASNGRPCVR